MELRASVPYTASRFLQGRPSWGELKTQGIAVGKKLVVRSTSLPSFGDGKTQGSRPRDTRLEA